ncbi:hypothetical protein JNB62_02325 [Microbacterium jejuense]|uniref:Exonuclease SbcCD, C subunit n=1 Tax=Microbacterium jejuense TaxID=1263637 RepID=A0ABS7HJC1_9MICO|nr:SbcC/MukB-like Walker B domain-containing protein [Microbacterium jejuense]MBW9092515.1 hypothetical protein [Microbacterium jejuense]
MLRPFALTLLVRSDILATVRRWVDEHHLGTRLVYEEVERNSPPPRPASSPISLVHRVSIADGAFAEWVSGALSERYDVACVDAVDDLDDHARAVTINGQIKSSRTRYEKNDRIAIAERSHWVLGDRDAKLEALVERRQAAQREWDAANDVVRSAMVRQRAASERVGALRAIREQRWADIDRDTAASAVADLRHQLVVLTRGDGDLQQAIDASEAARAVRDRLRGRAKDAGIVLSETRHRLRDLDEVVAGLDAEIASGALAEVDEETTSALDTRYRAVQRSIARSTIAEVGQQVQDRLHRERDRALTTAIEAGNLCQRLITEFVDHWPAASADLSASIADRRGFLEMLNEIVAHGLPEYEARFLQLFRERSSSLIGELRNEILGAPREIEDRVRPVNASLRRSPFDADRYLRLRVKTRRTDTVNRFMNDLKSISEGSWGDDDAASAEARFALLADLMRRFSSSDHVDRVWTSQCLDTRLHVRFRAEEIDDHDRVHATYDSGAAMSGGQQQKLVVFCLAAALRYRLADPDDEYSRYGTIVLDEAFDKADTRYTRMALDVFVAFGFQLVLATPQKLLQTIEPYVGAATSIDNPTRRRSTVADVTWTDRATDEDNT